MSQGENLKPGGAVWTEAEDAKLRVAYAKGGIHEAVKALSTRSITAIYQRTRRLGVMRRFLWTPEEDLQLTHMWGNLPLKVIVKKMERPIGGIRKRVIHLKLGTGCPNRYEYLTAAARRVGYNVETLQIILKEARVRVRRSYAFRKPGSGHRHRWIVEPAKVDRAVERRGCRETLFAAAKLRGVGATTLRDWLILYGKTPPKKKKDVWRIPTADIDRALKARARYESVKDGALRVGVSKTTLAKWMKKHGFALKRGKSLKADIDRVVGIEGQRGRAKKILITPLAKAA